MIIDAHAHIFSRINGQRGKERTLSGRFGKVFTGKRLSQALPPLLSDSSFNAEMLVELMDYSGVDKAVLLQNPVYGIINDEISNAIEAFPNRFIGSIQVDPMSENALHIIKKIVSPRQSVLKFEISEEWGWSGIYPGLKIDSIEFIRIWELAVELGLQVIIDTGSINNSGYQVEQLDFITDKYPDLKILLEHFGYLTSDKIYDKKSRIRRLELINLAKKPNVFLGYSATNILLDEDYPCPISLELLHETVLSIGSGKILWGSDIPSTLCKYTYQQMIDVIEKHAYFLNAKEKEKILGSNAFEFFTQFNL